MSFLKPAVGSCAVVLALLTISSGAGAEPSPGEPKVAQPSASQPSPPAGAPVPAAPPPTGTPVPAVPPTAGTSVPAAPPPANAWPPPASATYPPGAGAYPPGAGAYPPGAGAYPPGAGAYPPGAGTYPPGAGAYPPGAVPYPYAYPYPLPEKPQRTWYGWQTLIVLGASTGALALSGFANGSAGAVTAPIGIGGFALGGPIVHWAHGNTAKGFISLGMNVGSALLGGGIGASVACAGGGCNSFEGGFFVFFASVVSGGIALVSANIVDVTVFAYDERPARRPSSVGGFPFTLAPTIDVRKDRASFGLAGTF